MPIRFSRAIRTAALSTAATIACSFAIRAHAAPTWQVQENLSGAISTSETRVARGIAISSDGSEEYLGFIQGTGAGSTAVREYPSAVPAIPPTNPTPTASIGTSGNQPKGVAVDDRGNVYSTYSNSAGALTQRFAVYDSALSSSTLVNTQTQAKAYQLGGIAVQKVGANYLLYVATNKGTNGASGSGGTIDIYNVNTPTSPTFVSTINLHSASGGSVNAQVNGLDVAPNGLIYATASTTTNTNIRGDTVYKIDSTTDTIVSSVAVTEAMDDVLYNGTLYVAEYNADGSAIGVVDPSTMTVTDTWNTGFTRTGTPTDSGYAGISVSPDGRLYVVDEQYVTTIGATTNDDRVLVSSALPEPASLACLAIGGLVMLRRRRVIG